MKGVDQIASFNPYQETSGTTSNDCGGMMAIHTNVDGAYMEPIYLPEQYKYSWTSIKSANFGSLVNTTFTAKLDGPANTTGNMKVCLDSLEGKTIVDVPVAFDANGNATVSAPVNNISGVHDVYFELSGQMYQFVSWKFSK